MAHKRHDKCAPLWKKGQSGNPLGGKLHDPELKKLKNLTKSELVDVGNLIIRGNFKELEKLSKDPNETALRRMVAAQVMRAISSGDTTAFEAILNRLVGKVKDEVMQQMEIRTPQVIVTLPDNGRNAKDEEPGDDYGF